MIYSWFLLIIVNNNIIFWVIKRNLFIKGDVSFTRPKLMFDRNLSENTQLSGLYKLCLSPINRTIDNSKYNL